MTFGIIDLETSGLPEARKWKRHEDWAPEILEVGACTVDGRYHSFERLVRPSYDVWSDWRCKKALAVSHIEESPDMVDPEDAALALRRWCGDAGITTLIAWRGDRFDFLFLRRMPWALALAGIELRDIQPEVTALLEASGHCAPSSRGVSLQAAYALTAERTGKRWEGEPHRALTDCLMTARVARCLLGL